jgi:D-hexose-6-phosphate mutarotase
MDMEPNAATFAAIEETRQSKGERGKPWPELLAELMEDDDGEQQLVCIRTGSHADLFK